MMIFRNSSPSDFINNILEGLENWCIVYNEFFIVLFIYLKFLLAFILASIGLLTLFKVRGIYLKIRQKNIKEEEDRLKNVRLILGFLYLFLAFGILFNFFTYLLIICLDPIPDRFIFNFISFNGDIDTNFVNRIEDIEAAKYPHEKTIYYAIAFFSFSSFLDLALSTYYIINSNRMINNPKLGIYGFVWGLIGCIMCGFTTFLPLFL